MIEKNVKTDFSAKVSEPVIGSGTFVHPLAAVIGNVILGNNVMVAPTACVRGDEGQPLYVGDDTNVQDGVVIHALETELDGKPVEKNQMEVNGKKYAVYVGNRVSLAHQVQIHGPAVVMDDTFVGMKVLVFKSLCREKLRHRAGRYFNGRQSGRWTLCAGRIGHQNPGRSGCSAFDHC